MSRPPTPIEPESPTARDGRRLAGLVLVALALRVAAAVAVGRYVEAKKTPCVFPDTAIYWQLAGAVAAGEPYQVVDRGVVHRAIRAPGYPIFLAACRRAFGSGSLMPVRYVQAALGALGVALVYGLVRRVRPHGRSALAAAAIAAVEPYTAAMSALVLSEALFAPLLLASLWGLAALWPPRGRGGPGHRRSIAAATGVLSGLAILARPSWLLGVPLMLGAWVLGTTRGHRAGAIRGALLVALAAAATMAPWWARNARVYGRFVPTVLWVGASLYDGLSPTADGSSDMRFMGAADVAALDERAQDEELKARALDFARDHPRRALALAAIKVGRFWSPWPNAESMRSAPLAAASAAATLPVYALMILGLWRSRRDGRALALLLLPLLYFCALHAVFVSSIRYRIPAEVPALGLAAVGAASAIRRDARRAAEAPPAPAPKGPPPSALARIGSAIAWALILATATAAGAVACAYLYVTDGETVARAAAQRAPAYLPGSKLAIGRAQVRPLVGEVTLNHLTITQSVDGRPFQAAQVPWLRLSHDVWAALHGRFALREVFVAQPTVRVTRRRDGSWNLGGLLADPWPGPRDLTPPVVRVRGGTVELVEEDAPPGAAPTKLLRDVAATIEPTEAGALRFEATAQGDAFERLGIEGEIDPRTGFLVVRRGDLTRLALSPTLARRLPAEARRVVEAKKLMAGEVDVALRRLVRDPTAPADRRVRYEVGVELRGGSVACPEMPFALNDVEASATIRDGLVALHGASGRNGKTRVRASGTFSADDPRGGAFDLNVVASDLELDGRLRAWTPAKFKKHWAEYSPSGWVSLSGHVARPRAGEPPGWSLTVDCLDVATTCVHFPYPLEHVEGTLTWQGPKVLDIALGTVVGNKPLTARGRVVNPGDRGVVDVDFAAGSMPLDETLMKALPADALAAVRQYHPAGSVRGTAHLHREPSPPGGDPRGRVALAVDVDLNDGCSMRWDGLPYPVSNMSGHLAIRPDLWTFTRLTGENGPARVAADGVVRALGPGRLDVSVNLRARHLSFDPQLRSALPRAWQATWDTLNPSGSSEVTAAVRDVPGRNDTRLTIVPESETRLQIELTPAPGTPVAGPGGRLRLPPMEDIRGSFAFRNGEVIMRDASCRFHGAATRFRAGRVRLRETGQFDLALSELEVAGIRLDGDLRSLMPPVMQQFARRLDDDGRHPFSARAETLSIGWSGRAGEPAACAWDDATVVFVGNTIQCGLPIGPIQGQAEKIRGRSDGRTIAVDGLLNIDSVAVLGQQVTRLSTPVRVGAGIAELTDVQADLLDGKLYGSLRVDLDATPRYSATAKVQGADLARFTQTIPGRQSLRGRLSAEVALSGRGADLHALQGGGSARVDQGDIGTLPLPVSMIKLLRFIPATKTAFDSASVAFATQDGVTRLDPVKLTGDAISLQGAGAIDPEGNVDLPLSVVLGRDDRLSGLKDLMSDQIGRVFKVLVHGPITSPLVDAAPLPSAGGALDVFHRLTDRRSARDSPAAPARR